MKLSLLASAFAVTLACVAQPLDAAGAHVRVRVHTDDDKAGGAICYKSCPNGQWCARGTQVCRAPDRSKNECFNYATALFQKGCDPGFTCRNGKCDYAKKHHHHHRSHDEDEKAAGAICYKACPSGQYCARGTQTCRSPDRSKDECFNYATALFQKGCDPGFTCRNGKCDYAKKHHHRRSYDEEDDVSVDVSEDEDEVDSFDIDGDIDSIEIDGDIDSIEVEADEGEFVEYSEDSDDFSDDLYDEDDHEKVAGAICYKACPGGQYCARGTQTCRAPDRSKDECFNYATALFQKGCDPGFTCRNGKCDYAKKHHRHHHRRSHNDEDEEKAGGAICYKPCPNGQYCARGTQNCRAPDRKKDECFNYATAMFQKGCDPGFKCKNGKCDYA